MEHKNKKWNKDKQAFETRMNTYTIEDARKFLNKIDNDPDKEKRLAKQYCRCCNYRSRIAGQAFTNANCGKCDTEMLFSSTDVDLLCKECAVETKSCAHCGGEMD